MRRALAVASKDLRSDARARDAFPAMLLFAVTLVFLMSFAIPPGSGRAPVPLPVAGAVGVRDMASALLWTSILFAAIVGLGRAASSEFADRRIEGLISSPIDPAALFIGKFLSGFVYLTLLEAVVIPLFVLLIDIPTAADPALAGVALLANCGLAAAGTMFSSAAQHTRSKTLVMPLLFFPLSVPVVLSATQLSAAIMRSGSTAGYGRWFILMLAFDIVYLVIGSVTFEFVVTE